MLINFKLLNIERQMTVVQGRVSSFFSQRVDLDIAATLDYRVFSDFQDSYVRIYHTGTDKCERCVASDFMALHVYNKASALSE
jgi:hypothetical protein